MTEVFTPLPICSPSGLIIQAGGQSSTEDKLSSHRRRETGLDGEPLESRHAVSRSIGRFWWNRWKWGCLSRSLRSDSVMERLITVPEGLETNPSEARTEL